MAVFSVASGSSAAGRSSARISSGLRGSFRGAFCSLPLIPIPAVMAFHKALWDFEPAKKNKQTKKDFVVLQPFCSFVYQVIVCIQSLTKTEFLNLHWKHMAFRMSVKGSKGTEDLCDAAPMCVYDVNASLCLTNKLTPIHRRQVVVPSPQGNLSFTIFSCTHFHELSKYRF